MHHIRASLPDIKSRISANQQKFTAELLSLGGPLGDGNSGNIVLSVITEFTSEFRTTIDGNTNDLSLNELSGGARISFVFHELFNNGVKSIDPFDQVKDGDIRTILYNSSVRPNEHPKFLSFFFFFPYLPFFITGLNTSSFRWDSSFRGHREAADQASGRPKLEVLSIGV